MALYALLATTLVLTALETTLPPVFLVLSTYPSFPQPCLVQQVVNREPTKTPLMLKASVDLARSDVSHVLPLEPLVHNVKMACISLVVAATHLVPRATMVLASRKLRMDPLVAFVCLIVCTLCDQFVRSGRTIRRVRFLVVFSMLS